MNADVMRAILAMDSYNRSYGQGVTGLAVPVFDANGNSISDVFIGTARIISDSSRFGSTSTTRIDEAAGFYASAYSWNGRTYISYRGTNPEFGVSVDTFLNSPGLKDVWSGWRLGLAIPFGGQPELAIKFYQDVTGRGLYDVDPANTLEPVLVGHSLGGGLAGFVGSLSDNPVYAYDHMPYGLGAWAQAISDSYDAALVRAGVSRTAVNAILNESTPIGAIISAAVTVGDFMTAFNIELGYRKPIFSRVYGIHTEGEALIALRDGTIPIVVGLGGSTLAQVIGLGPLGALLAAASGALAVGTVELEAQMPPQRKLDDYGAVFGGFLDNPLARHSMALLTVLEYGEKGRTNNPTDHDPIDWQAAAKHVLPAVLNDEIGAAVGRKQGETEGGIYSPGAQLATIIAYSAIDNGTNDTGARPFGDTGIRALFNDTSDLGKVYRLNVAPEALVDAGDAIGRLITEYAGLLAAKSILNTNLPTAKNGILSFREVEDPNNPTAPPSMTMFIDLRASKWNVNGDHEIAMRQGVIDAFAISDPDPEVSYGTIANWYADAVNGAPGTTGDLSKDVDRITIGLAGSRDIAKVGGAGVTLSVLSDDASVFIGGGAINFVIGGKLGDTIKGLGNYDILIGGDGVDMIEGGAGADFLVGGAGGDDVRGGAGSDTIYGGSGVDTLYGNSGNDQIHGGSEGDILLGGAGDDGLYGDTGVDILRGGDGNDYLYGGSGDDDLYGNIGNDEIHGGADNDHLVGDVGDDRLFGDTGNDVLRGGDGNDTLEGGGDRDRLYSGTGSQNILIGGNGRDDLFFDGGSGSAAGGRGNDTINLNDAIGLVNVNYRSGDGFDTIESNLGFDPETLNWATFDEYHEIANSRPYYLQVNFEDMEIGDAKMIWSIDRVEQQAGQFGSQWLYVGNMKIVGLNFSGLSSGIDLGTIFGMSNYSDILADPLGYTVFFSNLPEIYFADGDVRPADEVGGYTIHIDYVLNPPPETSSMASFVFDDEVFSAQSQQLTTSQPLENWMDQLGMSAPSLETFSSTVNFAPDALRSANMLVQALATFGTVSAAGEAMSQLYGENNAQFAAAVYDTRRHGVNETMVNYV
jgi:hypothetical protein